MWVFHFNFASVLMGFLAYYFYFAVSFDLATVYPQICRLIIDVQIPFRYFPYWSLLFVAWHLFQRWRRRIALSRLRRYEARNCGFINELPIVSITCGSMGKKKTTAITDMALSQEVMFRQKALEILQRNDMKFPFFPWICFEKELQKCMEYGTVYNLATVKIWVGLKRTRFMRHHNARWQLYGYDAQRYGFTYDDALSVSALFDVLETYAQAYFIYVIESSLIVANYSIRSDNVLMDEGNFPMWLSDFFPQGHRRNSRHAHILDFDVLRLGKKVIENNPNAGSFEFGVVAITEIGKERGNNLELQEKKKKDEEANQKNDLFNAWLKMCRHSATVDNFPFIKVFTDEQRPESWGADARDLCDIVNIASSSKQKLTYPLYTIEDMIAEWSFNRFLNLYYDFRFRRGDNTLLVHILKSITAWIWKRNVRVYNRYGYNTLKIEKERGIMDGKRYNPSKYLLYNDVLVGVYDSTIKIGGGEIYSQHSNKLKELESDREYGYIFKTARKLCDCLYLKADLGRRTRVAYQQKDIFGLKELIEKCYTPLIGELKKLYQLFTAYWEKLYKPYSFETINIRFGGLIYRIQYVKKRLTAYINGKVKSVPELEEILLDKNGGGTVYENKPILDSSWGAIVTLNIL